MNLPPVLARSLPWLLGGLIVAALVAAIDPAAVAGALQQAALGRYIPLAILFLLVWYLLETHNLQRVFRRFQVHAPFPELLAVRGYTYLLMIVNYALGVGAIGLYLRNRRGVPAPRAAGLLLFFMMAEMLALGLLAGAGATFVQGEARGYALVTAGAILGGALLGVPLIRRLAWRPALARWLEVFAVARIGAWLATIADRSLYFLTFVLFFYLAMPAFGLQVPFADLLCLVPLLFIIINLPVTAAGLGTLQAGVLLLFAPYGEPATLLAFSVCYSATIIIGRLPLGLWPLACRRPILRQVTTTPRGSRS
ncbi:MAG: lysylphosphatidylglycerol synthase domain-containing protein [Pseudomonadota bacterium]|nr:lysylphosphatidylglycerol synthase domain-containing protein [Pseudomonadota bacterium]